ncbi:hypothetical protein AB0N17_44495 [Streptomyces sp. NPDC051133]|uniref:hypothetical protein n=1 Tax=Streptomyces sp. NPDC051133 TaxID=3155521 RepID=UPI003449BF9B
MRHAAGPGRHPRGRPLIGVGTGLITPLGFAALASSTPSEWLGQSLGAAEFGDAGGPLLGTTVASLTHGYAVLGVLLASVGSSPWYGAVSPQGEAPHNGRRRT